MADNAFEKQSRNSNGAKFMLAVIVTLCAIGLVWSFWPERAGLDGGVEVEGPPETVGDRSFQEALGAAEDSATEGEETSGGDEASDAPDPPG